MLARRHDEVPAVAAGENGDAVALADVRRRLTLYLTALWGQGFEVEALPDDQDATRPILRERTILLPARMRPAGGLPAITHYRAAAVHAAAHALYSTPFDPEALKPRQRLLVELIEDARVEWLAAARFPRLRAYWLALHPPFTDDGMPFARLIGQLARALAAPHAAYRDDYWVDKGVSLFLERLPRLHEPAVSREIGLRLAHDLGQMRLSMDESGAPPPLASYRDDNRHLWREVREMLSGETEEAAPQEPQATHPEAFLEESEQGRRFAFAENGETGGDAGAGYRVEVDPERARLSFNVSAEAEAESAAVRYPEWFEHLGLARPDWCTLRERAAAVGDAEAAERLLAARAPLLRRLRGVVGALRARRVVRLRAQESGDDLDLDAAIRILADIRNGEVPDAFVYERRQTLHDPAFTATLLLDLSESVNAADPASGRSVLELAREAALLLGQVMSGLGHALAIAGFRSNGRHEIDYVRVKGFAEGFGERVRGRLCALEGGGSTRMGAAIRHAADELAREAAHRRVLMVVTDGEPSDIDVFDEAHLVHDARRAVLEARARGVQTFCVSLDPRADAYVERIFGAAHFLVLDRMEALPERLTQLFLRFARAAR